MLAQHSCWLAEERNEGNGGKEDMKSSSCTRTDGGRLWFNFDRLSFGGPSNFE